MPQPRHRREWHRAVERVGPPLRRAHQVLPEREEGDEEDAETVGRDIGAVAGVAVRVAVESRAATVEAEQGRRRGERRKEQPSLSEQPGGVRGVDGAGLAAAEVRERAVQRLHVAPRHRRRDGRIGEQPFQHRRPLDEARRILA